MKQRINIITLGVNDLKKSLHFYREGLGWKTKGIIGTEYENGKVVLFDLDNGLTLSLYERKNLAWDSTLDLQPASATEFSIGYFCKHCPGSGQYYRRSSKSRSKDCEACTKNLLGWLCWLLPGY